MQLQGCRCRLSGGADSALSRTRSKHPEVFQLFPGHQGLCSKTPPVRQRTQVSLQHFEVDWEPVWVAVCFESLKYSLGLGITCFPPEQEQRPSQQMCCYHELALFHHLSIGGFVMWRKRLVLMNEWGTSVASCWAAVLTPVIFLLKRD